MAVVLNFEINGRRAIAGAKVVTRALGSIAKSAKSVVSTAINPLTAAIGALAAFQSAKGLITIADSYLTLGAQMEFVTGNAQDAAQAQQELYDMSKKTRTSMTANAAAFVRLSQAQEMTGFTASENVRILGGLNALMLKTGTSGASAEAAMTQLTQALTSGVLAGDEFKSISENAPALMKEFALALGFPRSELKKMASEGKITAEVMGKALMSIAEQGEQSFDQLPKTVSSGWQLIVNAFEQAWVKINSETGITGKLFDVLVDLADWIEDHTDDMVIWAEAMVDALIKAWPHIRTFFFNVIDWFGRMFKMVYDNWDAIEDFFGSIVDSGIWMKNNLGPVLTWLIDKFETLAKVSKYTPIAGLARGAGTLAGGGGIIDAAKAVFDADESMLEEGGGETTGPSTRNFTSDAASEPWWSGSDSGGRRVSEGGMTIVNNFNTNLGTGAITDITTRQTREANRG